MMTLQITIEDEKFTEKKGVSKEGGKPYCIREQVAYVQLVHDDGQPKKFPTEMKVNVPDGVDSQGNPAPGQPYKPGAYLLAPQSFYVGQYGQLLLGRAQLIPMPAAMQQAKK